MEATIKAVGEILINAVPTFILVVLLHFYLRRVLFRPLETVLRQRFEATEGARMAAQSSLEKAERKAAEYEAAIKEARSAIYREQEDIRLRWREEQLAAIGEARAGAEAMIRQAREEIAAEAAGARQRLKAESEVLADRIADSVLGAKGRAS
jgi:F-type H+-transporting ATPase subunit b